MISQGLKMLKRAIDERPKNGMQAGMPKIKLREADAVRAVSELEWAQKRITELKAALKTVKAVLESDDPAIADTIWVPGEVAETLLDHVCAALEATKGETE